jgi:hypothetical protein
MSLDDLPKRVQYVMVDSGLVNGTNNNFSLDLSLKSSIHAENINQVIGLKVVEFYVTQVGGASNVAVASNIAKFIDIKCDDIPKIAQILDERHGQILARVPLERHFSGAGADVIRDKQWKPFQRRTNLFNPISMKKLHFKMYEYQDDGDYVSLHPDTSWHMILEVTTISPKEKPRDKNVEILKALEKLTKKIEVLNHNVRKLPDRPPEEDKKKYPFGYLMLFILTLVGGFIYMVNRGGSSPVPVGVGY